VHAIKENTVVSSTYLPSQQTALETEILTLVRNLGTGGIDGVAYDTAWVARLAGRYPGYGFEDSIEWLRRNQYDDGTWGASLLHYHDRFASTLAAIVALREVGSEARDERRVKRGEAALWKLVSRLGRDDSDTVGFPIVSLSLAQDALELGLDVPRPPIRYAAGYKKKVQSILAQPNRDWRKNALSFSLEGLWRAVGEEDTVLEANHSVASSPAATAAYLFSHVDEGALDYLQQIKQADGSIPALAPIDVFDISWSMSALKSVQIVQPDNHDVQQVLNHLWERWSTETGLYYSSYFKVPDLDITSASFVLLRWGGFPVEGDIFEYFEMEDHFCTYREESNPSPAAHLRLLLALQACPEHPKQPAWMQKTLTALRRYDENGSFWWDKWHASPYYVSNLAVRALYNVDRELAATRLKWILRTHNDDGGWGYLDTSTAEETAYCLDTLLLWNRHVETIDPAIINAAGKFLMTHSENQEYTPLWISKGLYTPHNIVKSAIVSALFNYMER
jgi:halimadienyl-diphosphate synthase